MRDSTTSLPDPPKKRSKILTDELFSQLDICQPVKNALSQMGMQQLTVVQSEALRPMLDGRDVLVAAKTGSGKTLAFVVPSLQIIYNLACKPENGCIVLVLSPTRELAQQIADVARDAGQFVKHTFGILMGGSNKVMEIKKLASGVNFLIATPGRLVDHIKSLASFSLKSVQLVILDEADRMLDDGFDRDLRTILNACPRKRQTALFSATLTTQVCDLVKLSLINPIEVHISDNSQKATVEGLTQGFVVVTHETRLSVLYKILKKKLAKKQKVMVFFSTCASVQFHSDLFTFIDLPNSPLHGKMKQNARTQSYHPFSAAEVSRHFCSSTQFQSGILLCTSVAARGLDISHVDWVIQYDPPGDIREYVHRVGRTARGEGGSGSALLFLTPDQLAFIKHLKIIKVNPKEYTTDFKGTEIISNQIQKLVLKNVHLQGLALRAYKAYINVSLKKCTAIVLP